MQKRQQDVIKNSLVQPYYEEYKARNKRFLLFDIAHANENSHTRLLLELLRYKENLFLSSFIKRLGLPEYMNLIKISDQEPAVAKTKQRKGYIDLYISYQSKKGKIQVIIENKIYGAVDTPKQLARYVASINGITKEGFDKWYASPSVCMNTHVVYLTADGTKEPNEGQKSDFSLPEKLEKALKTNFCRVNYANDILPWLEEDVMPNIPYEEDGMMIAGLRQYIAYLKQLLSDEVSEVVEDYVKSIKGNDIEKYNQLLNAIDKEYDDIPEIVIKSLRKDLRSRAEAIFAGDVPDGWVLHFTPSFIIFFKKSWAALDARKYSIPSLYIYAGSTKTFLERGCFNNLKLGIDHLSPSLKNDYMQYEEYFGNHDKNIGFDLLPSLNSIQCLNRAQKELRQNFYQCIICSIKKIIDVIDKEVVEVLQNSYVSITSKDILEKVVSSKSQWNNIN